MTKVLATGLSWLRKNLSPFYGREAALCAPAIGLLIALSALGDFGLYPTVAAGAAFSVGFGAARTLRGMRWGAMLGATLGMTAAAFVASLAGSHLGMLLVLAMALAAGTAVLALYNEDLWWVVLQVVIAFLVASYFPSDVAGASRRAAAVLGGGALQIAVVVGLARLFPSAGEPLPAGLPQPPPERRLLIAHALRAAASVAVALLLARGLHLDNDYWAPMTALLVLKPGLLDTNTRGIYRLAGTLAGCVIGFVVIGLLHNEPVLIGAVLPIAAASAFAFQKAHYAILTAAITITVLLLLQLTHGNILETAEHRIAATLLGGGLALMIARIAPHHPSHRSTGSDHIGA